MYVWEVLEHPEHSWLGLSITAVIILAILASITSFVLSGTPSITSQPATRAKWNTAFAATEITTVAIFTTEIALRFWARRADERLATHRLASAHQRNRPRYY